jgi:peptidoglycan hydrolase-like protein with peptidoglycan-binding domain
MTELRVLKSGMSGDDVLSWQKFLKACGFTPGEAGTFDDATVQATVDFQRLNNLPASGRADNMTFGMAMIRGLQVIVVDAK